MHHCAMQGSNFQALRKGQLTLRFNVSPSVFDRAMNRAASSSSGPNVRGDVIAHQGAPHQPCVYASY